MPTERATMAKLIPGITTASHRPDRVQDWRGKERRPEPEVHLRDAERRLRMHEDRCLKCCMFLLERAGDRCTDGRAIMRQIELIHKAMSQ